MSGSSGAGAPFRRLAAVSRVRAVRERQAAQALARAHAAARDQQAEVARRDAALAARPLPPDGPAVAFPAAPAARRALAGDLAAARRAAVTAAAETEAQRAAWTQARADQRAVELLAEGERLAARAEADRAERAEADDRAAATWLRARPTGGPG